LRSAAIASMQTGSVTGMVLVADLVSSKGR